MGNHFRGIAGSDPLSVDHGGDDQIDAPRYSGGLVCVAEVLHPHERGLAIPPC